MSKLIPVGETFAIVDDEDYDFLSQFSWSVSVTKTNVYAIKTRSGSRNHGPRGRLMHRILTGFDRTDHVNRNGLDNRRENLREASRSQNGANQRIRTGGTSRFKGVHFVRATSKWAARIRVNGVRKSLGHFVSEEDAARAYDEAAKTYFGEFACLNFPE